MLPEIDSNYPSTVVHLQHELYNTSVDTVQAIIQRAKARGYEFIRMDECLKGNSSTLQPMWDWWADPVGDRCLDDALNPLGGASCNASSQCGSGYCDLSVSVGQCVCYSGWTCPRCSNVTTAMLFSDLCPGPDFVVPTTRLPESAVGNGSGIGTNSTAVGDGDGDGGGVQSSAHGQIFHPWFTMSVAVMMLALIAFV